MCIFVQAFTRLKLFVFRVGLFVCEKSADGMWEKIAVVAGLISSLSIQSGRLFQVVYLNRKKENLAENLAEDHRCGAHTQNTHAEFVLGMLRLWAWNHICKSRCMCVCVCDMRALNRMHKCICILICVEFWVVFFLQKKKTTFDFLSHSHRLMVLEMVMRSVVSSGWMGVVVLQRKFTRTRRTQNTFCFWVWSNFLSVLLRMTITMVRARLGRQPHLH